MKATLAKIWAIVIMPPILVLLAMFIAIGAMIHTVNVKTAAIKEWCEKNPITVYSKGDTYIGYVMQEFPDKYVLTDTEGVVYKIDRPAIVKIQKAPDATSGN